MLSDQLARLLAVAVLACTPFAQARALEVFACEPEWAALVRELAPDARVTSATHARQDPHHIEARPALIASLRRADLAVCTGASLEAGWLPMLQQRAGNAAVQAGRPGLFFAASAVTLIDQHEHVDRSMGDVHAEGNPHFHLDPGRLSAVAQALAARLAQVDPAGAERYAERYRAWRADWDARVAGWEQRARPLAGTKVVAQHSTFAYLWRWLRIEQAADLEPLPGSPPTAAHLQRVLQQVGRERPAVIVQTLYQDPQPGQWLAGRTGLALVALPSTVTAEGRAQTLPGLFDALLDELLRHAQSPAR